MHQASVINKPRLNIIGVKGYGCIIKIVMLRWCPNITSTAKRQGSILTFKSKLLLRKRKYFMALFALFGKYRNDRPELKLSYLPSSSGWGSRRSTQTELNNHVSACHPKAAEDHQICERKYCCSGNLTFLMLSLNMK